MTPKEKANFLINEKYYQPLTIHLNVTNNSKQMWEYAKSCALIAVEEIISEWENINSSRTEYWEQVKQEIEKL